VSNTGEPKKKRAKAFLVHPPEEIRELLRLHREGVKIRAIQKKLGWTHFQLEREMYGRIGLYRTKSPERQKRISKIPSLVAKGYTDEQIAWQLDLSRSVVQEVRSKQGIPANNTRALTKAAKGRIVELAASGLSCPKIAAAVGVRYSVVYAFMVSLNLPRRSYRKAPKA
jgi:hypothetical protein